MLHVWLALLLAVSLLIRTLKCSGTGLGSGGKKEACTRSGLSLVGCPNFAHSFCQCSSIVFVVFQNYVQLYRVGLYFFFH